MPYTFKVSNHEPLQMQVGLNLRRMAGILISGPLCDDLHAGLSAFFPGDNEAWKIPCWLTAAEVPMMVDPL